MTGPITWKQAREDVASLYEGLVAARDSGNEAVLSPSREVPVGAEYREAFCDLRWDVDSLVSRAERLLERLAESSEPEPPARPLEAVLADIRALGHGVVGVHTNGGEYGGRWRCESQTNYQGQPAGEGSSEAWAAYRVTVENGEAWAADPIAAAEARLEQIRELREQQRAAVVALAETLSYRPYGVDRTTGWLLTADIAISEAERAIGPEEVDTEHEAHVHVRWNVWKNEDDIGWFIVNANLNEEQAHRAIERRACSSVSEFMAVPVGQVPGGPPVTASDALVFLNPDPGVVPITGPTDAEEDDQATAEHCPQRPGGHVFDSYGVCVHCEYEGDAEEAALAREDARRVDVASEGDR